MLGEAGLKSRTANSTRSSHGARDEEEVVGARQRVAQVADRVEEDGGADDAQIDRVGTSGWLVGVAGLIAGSPAAEEAVDEREYDHEEEDAAAVGDGDEARRLEVGPVEHVAGVDDGDVDGAHVHPEDGRVDAGEQEEVAAQCRAGTFALGVQDFKGLKEVEVADLIDPVGRGWDGGTLQCMLLACCCLTCLGERLRNEKTGKEDERNVNGNGDVKDGNDGSHGLDEVRRNYGPKSHTGKERGMKVSKHGTPSIYWNAVRGVRVCNCHCGDKRTAESLNSVRDKDPIHGEPIWKVCGAKDDGVANQHARAGNDNDSQASIAIRECAQLWRRYGAQDT